MSLSLLEGALGGIGLFLLGMRLMSDGIRTVANDRIRRILATLTSSRIYSLLFGMVMSLSLNSATAAVIFTIGLANGGVLSAFQALSILGGVLIGSSLTLHFPVIPYSLVATPLVFTGVLLKFFARRRRLSNTGDLLLGIGLLFLGLSLLEGSFRPFDTHPLYAVFSDLFFYNAFLSFIFGSAIACLVQSVLSSVSVVSSLATSHQLNPSIAYIMVLGGFTGVAVMGWLASVAGKFISRRIAITFLLITLAVSLSLVAVTPFLVEYLQILKLPSLMTRVPQPRQELYNQLTWIHTFVSLLIALLIVTFSGAISRFLGNGGKQRGNAAALQPCASYLDTRILNTPLLAIEQARKEIVHMMSVTTYMYADIREILFDFDARRADTIRQHEQVLDCLNHEITAFLAALAHSSNTPEISYDIPGLLQTVSDLEHIGDNCEEILDRIVARKEAGIIFSDAAMNDLKSFTAVVNVPLMLAMDCVNLGQQTGEMDLRNSKSTVRSAFEEMKQAHFERISTGVCPSRSAQLFMELSTAIMRIAELSWNIMAAQGRKTP